MERDKLFGKIETRDVGVTIKSDRELDFMRQAGAVVARTIHRLTKELKPGMTTSDLDDIAVDEIRTMNAKPSFKGYLGFPRTICTSINNEIVHGIPGPRIIKDGDLVKMDVGAVVGGFHGDSAVTVGAGNIAQESANLISITKEALSRGIAEAKAGKRVGDISWAIQSFVEAKGYSVVRQYVGHGIGKHLHEEPQVPNFGHPGTGPLLRKGMVIAIEPMVNVGGWETQVLNDNWTVITADGSLSAHFENTLAITDGEPEVLTHYNE